MMKSLKKSALISFFLIFTLLFSGVVVHAENSNLGEQVFTDTEFKSGDYLLSQNGMYRATYQGDGNFVVYRNADMKPLWSTGTNNKGAILCYFQGDSNFVISAMVKEQVVDHYVDIWIKVYNFDTGSFEWFLDKRPVYKEVVTRKAIWSSGSAGVFQRSRLMMQNDSNLVIYSPTGKTLWSTGIKDR